MHYETITLAVPQPYAFAMSVCDHGWPALAPFRWDEREQTLERVEHIDTQVVLMRIFGKASTIVVEVSSIQPLSTATIAELTLRTRWMLKLDQDYSEFYRLAAEHARAQRAPRN